MDIKSVGNKVLNAQINKSWLFLSYLYLLLPGLLFGLGVLFRTQTLGKTFASLFHNYGLFAISTIPNLGSFTGILGLGLAGWFLYAALRRRDWLDFGLSAVLVAANTLYFYFEVNYWLLGFLRVQ